MENAAKTFTRVSTLSENNDPKAFLSATKDAWSEIASNLQGINSYYYLYDDRVDVTEKDDTISFKFTDLHKNYVRMQMSAKFDFEDQSLTLAVGAEGKHLPNQTAQAMPDVESKFSFDQDGRQKFVEAFTDAIRTAFTQQYSQLVYWDELPQQQVAPSANPA